MDRWNRDIGGRAGWTYRRSTNFAGDCVSAIRRLRDWGMP